MNAEALQFTPQLFQIIDLRLMELLRSLTAEEWEMQTIAKKWKVKDVAAHLLDGNIRALSLQRDKYFGQPGPADFEFKTVVDWINQFNNNWVNALLHLIRMKDPSSLLTGPGKKKAVTGFMLQENTRRNGCISNR